MRLPSILGLILVLATGAGQRTGGGSPGGMRSGPPTLSFGNPFTIPNVPSRFGGGAAGSWRGNHWSDHGVRPAPILWWYWPPVLDGAGFYPPAYPGYGFDQSDAYQGAQPSIAIPQPAPAQPQPPDIRQPINGVSKSDISPENQSQSANINLAGETSTAENFRIETVSGPQCASAVDEYHPPIVALKNHSAYSASNYWTEGRMFHFLTTQGDHFRVPVSLVERIYPGSGQKTNR